MYKRYFQIFLVLTALITLIYSSGSLKAEENDHTGHSHAAQGHEHGSSCSHEHGHEAGEENEIELSDTQIKSSGMVIAVAASGKLDRKISLNGEVSVNIDMQTHHVAKTTGIAEQIMVNTGSYVRKNDVLAVLNSAELGQAKSEYFEIFNQVNSSMIDLQRARTISENTGKLLGDLKKTPQLDLLQKNSYGDMGEYRSILLSSYAEFITSQKTFLRKQKLFKDRIVSENDFINAQSSYEKAQAEYLSSVDNAGFITSQKLLEAEKQQKVNEFKLRTAERRLLLLGLENSDIAQLKLHGAKIMQECLDPGCKDCSFTSGKHFHPAGEDAFSRISIRAGRSGIVINRNIEAGEEVENSRKIFTIADLRNLWALLQVPAKDLALIRQDMPVILSSSEGGKTTGRISMINPVINEQTRTAEVRVTFSNDENRWFPGQFVNGLITIAADNLPVVVNKQAVQNINGDSIVFIKGSKGFRALDVKTGREDDHGIEIVSGLKAGQQYVAEGAFTLKSIMVTSGLDPHAGHGH
jgi:cobalt-zinc-cadmium efflux system membrane fusion protein